MKKQLDDILLSIAIYTDLIQYIGLTIIMGTALYDVVMEGIRGFSEYSIRGKGIAAILFGTLLIMFSKQIGKKINGR